MVQPAMPFGRHAAGVVRAIIDDPATGQSIGVRTAFIIDIALMVLTHLAALAGGVERGADGRAIPPGEDLAKDSHGPSA